jgi:tRNA dimethylallyltransferase
MNKLLVICGPTAVGKTGLAISLAKKFGGEIVSADSRQVYRGMDIGTGKDLPRGAKIRYPWFGKYGFYEVESVKIWGYDIADPRREFSVAQYLKIAHHIIDDIAKRKKFPILVGGTGLYIKGVVDGIPTAAVPPSESLRKNLEGRSVDELYERLSQMDSLRAASLNSSDKKNPRRLIRAIEIAQYQLTKKTIPVHHAIAGDFDILYVGLSCPIGFLERKIAERIEERIKNGVKDEVRKLLRMGVKWEDQSMNALGYGVWRDNFEGGVDEKHVISEWERDEDRFAKRQITWFRKDKRINWFDITQKGYIKSVEKLVKKWYSTDNVSKN